jgi:Domain of unknown function (DUF4355)
VADDNAPDQGGAEQHDDVQQDQQHDNGGQQGREDTNRQEHENDVRQEAKDEGKTLTQAEVDKIVADRVKRERSKFADYDELKKRSAKLKEIEDGQKSELQKVQEREQALQVELQGYRVAEIRRAAASAAGLDSELAEFITAVDEEEAKAQAERLAERFKATAKQQQSADFKQGTRTTPPAPQSRDELLRALAGHGKR